MFISRILFDDGTGVVSVMTTGSSGVTSGIADAKYRRAVKHAAAGDQRVAAPARFTIIRRQQWFASILRVVYFLNEIL
jgi:hypothetical protein